MRAAEMIVGRGRKRASANVGAKAQGMRGYSQGSVHLVCNCSSKCVDKT